MESEQASKKPKFDMQPVAITFRNDVQRSFAWSEINHIDYFQNLTKWEGNSGTIDLSDVEASDFEVFIKQSLWHKEIGISRIRICIRMAHRLAMPGLDEATPGLDEKFKNHVIGLVGREEMPDGDKQMRKRDRERLRGAIGQLIDDYQFASTYNLEESYKYIKGVLEYCLLPRILMSYKYFNQGTIETLRGAMVSDSKIMGDAFGTLFREVLPGKYTNAFKEQQKKYCGSNMFSDLVWTCYEKWWGDFQVDMYDDFVAEYGMEGPKFESGYETDDEEPDSDDE